MYSNMEENNTSKMKMRTSEHMELFLITHSISEFIDPAVDFRELTSTQTLEANSEQQE